MKMSLIYPTTKQFKIVAFFLLSFLCSEYIMAQVYVQGYHRKDGTYVKSHYRSSPDSSPYNNYSYPGNTNPYTGKVATGNTETYLKNYYGNYSNSSSTYNNSASNYSTNSYPTNTYNNTITYPSYNMNTYSTGANNYYKSKTTKKSTYSTNNPYNSIFNE